MRFKSMSSLNSKSFAHKEGIQRRNLLNQWYRRDDNATPSVYCLQPREKDFQGWGTIQDDLHSILLEAVEKMSLLPDQRMKYIASATEQEITEGVFRVSNAKEHVYCFSRKIKTEKNLPITENLPPDASVKYFVDLKDGSLQAGLGFQKLAG